MCTTHSYSSSGDISTTFGMVNPLSLCYWQNHILYVKPYKCVTHSVHYIWFNDLYFVQLCWNKNIKGIFSYTKVSSGRFNIHAAYEAAVRLQLFISENKTILNIHAAHEAAVRWQLSVSENEIIQSWRLAVLHFQRSVHSLSQNQLIQW